MTTRDEEMADLLRIYNGSDGNATKALYDRLETYGPVGQVAMNLFRAQKCSARAKVYRGGNGHGSYRSQAYSRKQYSMQNLAKILGEHAKALGISWGWGRDDRQEKHDTVLYVDLPTGQVSFHTEGRGEGPDYPGKWDGVRNASTGRIIGFCVQVLVERAAA